MKIAQGYFSFSLQERRCRSGPVVAAQSIFIPQRCGVELRSLTDVSCLGRGSCGLKVFR